MTGIAGLISAIAALIGGLIAAGYITGSHPRAAVNASSHVTRNGLSGGGKGGNLSGGDSSGIGSGGSSNSGGSSSTGSGSGYGSGSGPGGGGSGSNGGSSSGGGSGTGGGASGSNGGSGSGSGSGCSVVALSDTSTLQGTYLFDFDSGTETQSGADVWWDQHTDTVRSLDPWSGAGIVNLGAVDYGSISCAALLSESYASTPIDGNNDSTNQLVSGDVFAIRTDQGNYAKVQVISYGYDLDLRFETYRAS